MSRIGQGVGANFLGYLLQVGTNVLLVPLFLRSWGKEIFGEWLILSAAVGYFSLLDLGVQSYVVNRLSQSYSQGKLEEFHRDLHSGMMVIQFIILIGFVGLCVLVGFVPLDGLLNLRVSSVMSIRLTVFFLGSLILFSAVFMGLIGGLYRATGAFARGTMIVNVFRILRVSMSVGLLFLSSPMWVLAMSWLLFDFVVALFIVYDLRRFRPDIHLMSWRGDISHGLTLLGPSVFFLLISVANTINLQGTILVLGFFGGSVAVAQFGTLRTLSNFVFQAGQLVSVVLWPEMTMLDAQGNREHFERMWKLNVKLFSSFALFCAVFLEFAGKEIYLVWTQRRLEFDAVALDILLFQMVIMAFWCSAALPLLASNRHRAYSWLMLGNAVTTVLLCLFFVPVWGVRGVVLSSLLADIVWSFVPIPFLVSTHLGFGAWVYWKEVVLPGAAIGIGLGILLKWVLVRLIPGFLADEMWFSFSLMIFLAPAYALAVYLLWLTEKERNTVRTALGSLCNLWSHLRREGL